MRPRLGRDAAATSASSNEPALPPSDRPCQRNHGFRPIRTAPAESTAAPALLPCSPDLRTRLCRARHRPGLSTSTGGCWLALGRNLFRTPRGERRLLAGLLQNRLLLQLRHLPAAAPASQHSGPTPIPPADERRTGLLRHAAASCPSSVASQTLDESRKRHAATY